MKELTKEEMNEYFFTIDRVANNPCGIDLKSNPPILEEKLLSIAEAKEEINLLYNILDCFVEGLDDGNETLRRFNKLKNKRSRCVSEIMRNAPLYQCGCNNNKIGSEGENPAKPSDK